MAFFKQALLVAVTAVFVVVIIPSYFKPSYPVPGVFGTVAPGFEEVREVFRRNFENELDSREAGSAFSVYYEGTKVVDLWAGYADQEAKRLWKEDTMTALYSTTKGLAALCAVILVDRGHLDFKKPVAFYWPEFADKGKGNITVEQLLGHEGGLYMTDEPFTFDLLRDYKALDKVLAETTMKWEPGTKHGYHGMTFGFYVDALIRRVDPKRRSVGQFFDEEVRQPFGIDAYIGVPLEVFHRVGRIILVHPTWKDIVYGLRNSPWFRTAAINMVFGQDELTRKYLHSWGELLQLYRFADPDVLNMEIPSGNGVSTARGLAKMFGILANGGKYEGKTLMSKKSIDNLVNDNIPPAPDFVLYGVPMRWKYGFNLIPQPGDAGNMFGSPGLGGQVAYADPNNKLSYCFVSRYFSPMGIALSDPRFQHLQDSVLRAVHRKVKGDA